MLSLIIWLFQQALKSAGRCHLVGYGSLFKFKSTCWCGARVARTANAGVCKGFSRLSVVIVLGNKNFPAGVYTGRDLTFILPTAPAGHWVVTALLLTLAELHGCSAGRASSSSRGPLALHLRNESTPHFWKSCTAVVFFLKKPPPSRAYKLPRLWYSRSHLSRTRTNSIPF